jgi:hypothetical protein
MSVPSAVTTPNESNTTAFVIQYPVRSGVLCAFDASPAACDLFGFYSGERVQVRGGRMGWVVGVHDNNLYFHLDGDKGASYFCGHTLEQFVVDGFQVVSPRLTQARHNDNNRKVHIAPGFKSLIGDKMFADVSFSVGGKTIPAHKNILVARSEYFRAMFTSGMKENAEAVIPLPNTDLEIFTSVLQFLYTGQVDVDAENISAMLEAAAMFAIDD